MNLDAKYLCMALAQNFSYNQARYWHDIGLLDDIDWDIFRFIWQNSAPRDPDSVCAQFQIRE